MEGLSGLVLSIERFSAVDGPGIRSVVFMKGCPLRCKWCSRPTSWVSSQQLLVVRSRCIGCGRCSELCPVGAVGFGEDEKVGICWSKCTNCLKCAPVCPSSALAIAGADMNAEEAMDVIRRDKVFYDRSGGGVTISGGEPLLQSGFVSSLLIKCRDEGIQTAIETSGCARWEDYWSVLQNTNFVMSDLKLMDPEEHRRWTGRTNDAILGNLSRLASEGSVPNMEIHFPLITGINDSERNLQAMCKYVRELGHVDTIRVLPYHRLGLHEYQELGIAYPLEWVEPPSAERIRLVMNVIEANGLEAK